MKRLQTATTAKQLNIIGGRMKSNRGARAAVILVHYLWNVVASQ